MKLLSILISLSLLLHSGSVQATAMGGEHQTSSNQFERIEQPPELKAIVTLGGVMLIGLELWWFLFSKRKITND